MVHPATVRASRTASLVAVFTALILASNLALADVPNVKLEDVLVFVAAFVFGFRVGASVGMLSEVIWSVASPWGMGGYITPFLVLGEVLYAVAGASAARLWGEGAGAGLSARSIFLGATVSICAFVWDIETNLGTALIAYWPDVTLQKVLATEAFGALFMVFHETSDFLLGSILAPLAISLILRSGWPKRAPVGERG